MKKTSFPYFVIAVALLVGFASPSRAAKNKAARQARMAARAQRVNAQRANAQRNAPVGQSRQSQAEQPAIAAPVAPPLVQSQREVSEAAAKIDAIVVATLAEAGQTPNPPASDEQFVRRVYLDIAGRIPTADEVTAFLVANGPDKRAVLIDWLLQSPGYRSQMFNWSADMLRVKDNFGKSSFSFVYQEWLKDRIAANSPWNETVYQMLSAEGRLVQNGPAGYLLRDPGMPLDNLSNTLTAFLGANVACAQCHDHPNAAWTQRQFYEMAAYFGDIETYNVKPNALVKKVIKESDQFDAKDKRLLTVLIRQNAAEVRPVPGKTLAFPDDYKYTNAKPGEKVKPLLFTWTPDDRNCPAYTDTANAANPRQTFAAWLTHRDNPRFAAAIANRLWQKGFGIAVQEPMTDLDDLSKSANPALLKHLASEMKRMNFDLREFQRVLFNTKTYQQRASITPDLAKGPYLFPGPVLRRMSAEQAWDSLLTLAVGDQLDRYTLKRADALRGFVIPGDKITTKAVEAKALELRGKKLKLAAMGNYEGADGSKAPPPRFAGVILARASELEQPSKESSFLRMFGQSDRNIADDSSREGGIPQVLMMMNGDVQSVISNHDARAMKSAAKFSTPAQQVESLYLSFLGRRPTMIERGKVLSALNQGMPLSDLTWVLFNTREFIFVQ